MERPQAPGELRADVARVHRDFAGVVHGIAVAVVGPRDADDAVQDAFLAIHRGFDAVRDRRALAAWVCRVARHACVDFRRRRARRLPTDPDREVDAVPARASDASDRELADRVLGIVRSLPDAYRETLVLRLVEGMTGPEIAARTGMTEGSVRVNLCRGMAALRERLRREGWP